MENKLSNISCLKATFKLNFYKTINSPLFWIIIALGIIFSLVGWLINGVLDSGYLQDDALERPSSVLRQVYLTSFLPTIVLSIIYVPIIQTLIRNDKLFERISITGMKWNIFTLGNIIFYLLLSFIWFILSSFLMIIMWGLLVHNQISYSTLLIKWLSTVPLALLFIVFIISISTWVSAIFKKQWIVILLAAILLIVLFWVTPMIRGIGESINDMIYNLETAGQYEEQTVLYVYIVYYIINPTYYFIETTLKTFINGSDVLNISITIVAELVLTTLLLISLVRKDRWV